MKGIFMTMDAAAALLITLVFISTAVSMLAAADHSSEDAVYMTRLARDSYEVNRTGSIPFWVDIECFDSSSERFNVTALEYSSSANAVVMKSVTVCP